MMDRDLYEILQVSPNAEQEVIESAYRRLAAKYHPDVNPSSKAAERMKEINAAYEVLRDPHQRARYDQERRRAPFTGRGRNAVPTTMNKLERIGRFAGTQSRLFFLLAFFGLLLATFGVVIIRSPGLRTILYLLIPFFFGTGMVYAWIEQGWRQRRTWAWSAMQTLINWGPLVPFTNRDDPKRWLAQPEVREAYMAMTER